MKKKEKNEIPRFLLTRFLLESCFVDRYDKSTKFIIIISHFKLLKKKKRKRSNNAINFIIIVPYLLSIVQFYQKKKKIDKPIKIWYRPTITSFQIANIFNQHPFQQDIISFVTLLSFRFFFTMWNRHIGNQRLRECTGCDSMFIVSHRVAQRHDDVEPPCLSSSRWIYYSVSSSEPLCSQFILKLCRYTTVNSLRNFLSLPICMCACVYTSVFELSNFL